ncbi:MAG: hypothetical protein PXY39_02440 [archaeon]|nr:hypothetical protein [archaeon]
MKSSLSCSGTLTRFVAIPVTAAAIKPTTISVKIIRHGFKNTIAKR